MMRAAAFFDGEQWREGSVSADAANDIYLDPAAPPAGTPRLDGVITGAFTDHHVHLALIDAPSLSGTTIGRAIDLGGPIAPIRVPGVRIAFAGAFMTPPGGYPSDRAWAPVDSVREIGDADAASLAVAEMKAAGAFGIKIASNSTAGPVFSDELVRTLVDLAEHAGLAVVAHAEGSGEAQRMNALGVHALAHAPFTERLTDAEIADQSESVAWLSTLAIHDGETRAIAIDNVRRFHAAGGVVRYGTDMGNGPTPVGLNEAEITALREAGINGDALLRALSPIDPLERPLFIPGGRPSSADPVLARPLTPADLKD